MKQMLIAQRNGSTIMKIVSLSPGDFVRHWAQNLPGNEGMLADWHHFLSASCLHVSSCVADCRCSEENGKAIALVLSNNINNTWKHWELGVVAQKYVKVQVTQMCTWFISTTVYA